MLVNGIHNQCVTFWIRIALGYRYFTGGTGWSITSSLCHNVYMSCNFQYVFLFADFRENTIHSSIAGSMLGQSRRRWDNIGPAMGECLVFVGLTLTYIILTLVGGFNQIIVHFVAKV